MIHIGGRPPSAAGTRIVPASIDKPKYEMYDLYNNYSGGIAVDRPEGKYAWTATVGTKGQIVIPREARELFGIKPGDTLILLGDRKNGIAIPPKSAFNAYFDHIFGGKK